MSFPGGIYQDLKQNETKKPVAVLDRKEFSACIKRKLFGDGDSVFVFIPCISAVSCYCGNDSHFWFKPYLQ